MNPLISICIPNLGRPRKLARLLRLIENNSDYRPYEVIVRWDEFGSGRRGCPTVLHECYQAAKGDVIAYLGNDCCPQPGWLKIAMEFMQEHFPDLEGIVGTADGYWHGEIPLHFIIGRPLIEKLGGYVFFPGYAHTCCDLELCERARKIGKYAWCEKSKVYHDHPIQTGWKKEDIDEVYKLAYNPDLRERDRALLEARSKQFGFYIHENFKSPVIPRRIFTVWLSETGEMPELVKKCIKTHEIPGWEHRLITLDNCDRSSVYVQTALAAKKWVKAVDYFKLACLIQEGGIYMDADVELLKPIPDEFLTDRLFAGLERNGWIGNGVIGACADNPILKKCLERVEREFRGDDDKNFESSVQVLTETVYAHDLAAEGVKLHAPEVFTPYDHQGKTVNVTEKSIAYHHFMVTWGYPAVHPSIDLRKRLGNLDGLKVLNIGIGPGDSGLAIQLPALPFEQIDHVEIHQPYIDQAKQKFWVAKKVNYHLADAREFPVENYDLVLAFDVLEHMPKEDALKLIARCPRMVIFGPLENSLQNDREGVDMSVDSQAHLSLWTERDFVDLGFQTEVLPGFHREHGEEWPAVWAWRTKLPEKTIDNPLVQWLNHHTTGTGVWKWRHYLDIYHRHFEKFRGKEVHIAEVGIYSGGSLQMWRDYLGPNCHVYGIDIQSICRKFENEWCKIFIGDQADREFWKAFRDQVPKLDILIDDGGHTPEQQRVTMEEILPHIVPGGVYVCEDILGDENAFAAHVADLSMGLHENVDIKATDMLAMGLSEFQRNVYSIHLYPHVAVIEKWENPPARFEAPGYGSEWIWTDPAWKL